MDAGQTCVKCGEWKPLTVEFWYKNKTYKSGFYSCCKECSKEQARSHYHKPEVQVKIKEYRAKPETKARLHAWYREYSCKPEVQARVKEYRQSEEYKARVKAYSQTPKQKAYYKSYNAVYDRKPEQLLKKRLYNKTLRGKAARAAANANNKAELLGLVGRLTTDDVFNMWERYPACLKCGQGRGVDHVIPLSKSGPNTPDNLQNLCPRCNTSKLDQTIDYRSDILRPIIQLNLFEDSPSN